MGPGVQGGEQQRDPVLNNVDSLKWPSDLHKEPVENKFLCAYMHTRTYTTLLFFIFCQVVILSCSGYILEESTDK